MVRDGPAQEALSGAEGHQAESGLPKRLRAPLSHGEAQLQPFSASFLPWRPRAAWHRRARSSAVRTP